MRSCSNLLPQPPSGLRPMAQAATSTDGTSYSDLWWNPAESGWGAHITLQADVAFMVLYVYDLQRQPRFFVASGLQRVDFSRSPATRMRAPCTRPRARLSPALSIPRA